MTTGSRPPAGGLANAESAGSPRARSSTSGSPASVEATRSAPASRNAWVLSSASAGGPQRPTRIRTSGNAARSLLTRYRVFDGGLGGRSAMHTTEHAVRLHERHQFRGLQARAGDLDADWQIVQQMGEHDERELIGDAVGRVAQHAQRFARTGKRWNVGHCRAAPAAAGAGSTPRRPTAALASHR